MFKNPFAKKPAGTILNLKIEGMHCVSCGLNIDGELEETNGIISASTNYAKSTSRIEFDDSKVSAEKIKEIIQQLGYSVH